MACLMGANPRTGRLQHGALGQYRGDWRRIILGGAKKRTKGIARFKAFAIQT
jgi:hypothetical protein